jgi:hypothetical protein
MAFKLDRSGMADIAKSDLVRGMVRDAAAEVARNARAATDLPVTTTDGTTDRAVVTVTIAHPGGAASQAKNGTLTRAAMAAGLDVRS